MWRGPRGNGISNEINVPLRWNADENILWKCKIDGMGKSSPIVMADSVFLTSYDEASGARRLLKVNRSDGAVVWVRDIWLAPPENQHRFNTSASSTPATDGKLVFTVVVDERAMQVVAFDYAGELKWRVSPGDFESKHGFAASPVLFGELVIVNGHQDGKAFLVALHSASGQEVWRYTPDIHLRSFSTPLIIEHEGERQLIVTGANQTVGLDPYSGRRIWDLAGPTEKAVSSPCYGEGMVFSFAGSPNPVGMAIELHSPTERNRAQVVWKSEKGMPYVPSPVLAGSYLHIVSDIGVYSCLEPKTGRVLKSTRCGGNCYSSPIFAANRIYLFEDSGRCTVIANDPTFNVLARNDLGELTQSTPAIAHGCIFVRTAENLVCIGPESTK